MKMRLHPEVSEAPLRAEIFSSGQLAQHARTLAAIHQARVLRVTDGLLGRLGENEDKLKAFNRATLGVGTGRRITPAAEWLLDNFHVIDEQVRLARRHLPAGYSRELPRLLNTASNGLPRVYDLVLELISHVDAQIDAPTLACFVSAYQEVSSLMLGELWAIPIMLRIGLIENLQRITSRLTEARSDRDLADQWVDRLQDMAEKRPSHLIVVVAEMAQADLPFSSSFVAEFSQRLSGQRELLHLARDWLEQHLSLQGLSIEQLVQVENQGQVADQVSVSHSITSLRFLGTLDWNEFVESMSLVELILRTDPADIYPAMDFATRDSYRHVIEFLARHCDSSEEIVARRAIGLSEEGMRARGAMDRGAHVGFYLVDKGKMTLAGSLGVRWPLRSLAERGIRAFPLVFYAGGILLLSLFGAALFMQTPMLWRVRDWRLLLLIPLLLLCASQLGVALMNLLSSFILAPKRLPRLDFSKGIRADCRTIVVVPTMLASEEGIVELLEAMEIHYLSNRDRHLSFALLTDFRDAKEESVPADQALLLQASTGVGLLNRKYGRDAQGPFFLLHRPRLWNPEEGLWMGYERKRGKLMEFNALLRGGARECFSTVVGDLSVLPLIQYVITLDTDTQLPRDVARQLVGTMAHRLNRPEFDPVRGIVSEGYGILQPRIGVSLPTARRSWFVRLFSGDAGIDPYTREVSDVYQDVFQEGSFIGKGIYDVDAFKRAMEGRCPENTVLSHDLLESCHVRSALLSDVQLYEEYPSRYNVDVNRRHRWIRGDWQITQWLLPRVPGSDARRVANPISVLSRWKILDNLRRSLVPVGLLLLITTNWILFPELGDRGLFFVAALVSLPGLVSLLLSVLRRPSDLPWVMHLRSSADSLARLLGQVFLTLAFLPYDAFISIDAIFRSLLRLLITHRRLLQWQSSGEVEGIQRASLPGFYATMWAAPVLALLGGLHLFLDRPPGTWTLLTLVGSWLLAPWIAWWISQPIETTVPRLSEEQTLFLRRTARKTWFYFETFVTGWENWLPPDNFQEIPVPTIATRTSPTNMGLALLANLAASDFGYLSVGGLVSRTRSTLATMQGLERFHGHFFNWYETRTLKPSFPLYVSSVDSGNLAGHLLTLASGLRELREEKLFTGRVLDGLQDAAQAIAEGADGKVLQEMIAAASAGKSTGPDGVHRLLGELAGLVARIEEGTLQAEPLEIAQIRALKSQVDGYLQDMRLLAPWLDLPKGSLAVLRAEFPGPSHAGEGTPILSSPAPTQRLGLLLAQLEHPLALQEIVDLDLGVFTAPELSGGEPANESLDRCKDCQPLLLELQHCVSKAVLHAKEYLVSLESLARQCDELAEMDFGFLFDEAKGLFATGFRVSEQKCDTSSYDLLASEARLCSYVAIALGQVPQDHWFSMGRLLVSSHGELMLCSWSGSMFEYLMPLLVMPSYEHTLLEQSCRTAVQRQIEYGKLQGVPWGISESGYNWTDVHQNYQYRAFGVPGLGLQRGLSESLVIAPYASALALMISPVEACENLQRLAAEGRTGDYGFYEAVDYTPERLPPGASSVTIRSFMVHHQAMSLLALLSVLRDGPMQRRFMACPALRAGDLLLQERVPKTSASMKAEDPDLERVKSPSDEDDCGLRVLTNPSAPSPEVQLLSNGRYHVALSSAGGGYSRWLDLSVTRWREDTTQDGWGLFVYLRDSSTGEYWSSALQPTMRLGRDYEAIFGQSRVEFRQTHAGIETHTEISVSPEDDVELRRITLTNRGSEARTIEVTSYAEVILAGFASDLAHPAFSNLFVQTEFLPASSTLLCSRPGPNQEARSPWLFHLMLEPNGLPGRLSFETDRSRFIGRGGTLYAPGMMSPGASLSNTAGSVLDPIVSLRRQIVLPPHASVIVDLVFGVSENRTGILALVEKYQNPRMGQRILDLAWTHSQVTLRRLNATEREAQLYCLMASALVYADPSRRSLPRTLQGRRKGQSGLWAYGISGNLPLVLLQVSDAENLEIVRDLLQAHAFWRMKGLVVDLVILNSDASSYRQTFHDRITSLIVSGLEAQMLDVSGGIFLRSLEQVSVEDRVLLQSVARICLDAESGSLLQQMERRRVIEAQVPAFVPTHAPWNSLHTELPARELVFNNGYGGFTKDGREYVITLDPGQVTPAPWVNVLANPSFGTLVSESGSAYTWLENSHEFRLTPWNNDPVRDVSGEAFYVRDEQSGQYWSPSPLPARGSTPHVIRHGFGYTIFEHTECGIATELCVFVATDSPVKIMLIKVRNDSGRPRRLSVTGYWEWVLGDQRQNTLLHVQTEVDPVSGALLARNGYGTELADRIAFIQVSDRSRTLTGDRTEFIGRNGSLAHPAALGHARLSGKVGAGLDPCGALQVAFDLPEGRERELCFLLGAGQGAADVQTLIQRFRLPAGGRAALEKVWAYWNATLGAVNVDSPDPAVNLMANGWLLYQTLSCRIWARTGFYQSSGAFGFRDQLQDVMALVHSRPALAREHLLRAAGRQFREGDVQHWWHPPSGRGVRTRFSDDYLWLPYATCRYVGCLSDTGVLDERVPFLEARPLKPNEEAFYDQPNTSDENATLYEHCVRALQHGLSFGVHGLPLMGCGDWNDGMNRVGIQGRGESVWLAFFLYDVLSQFAPLARVRQDLAFSELCLEQARRLRQQIEAGAWDGEWYRRAYYDDGEPMGSASKPECQIDSLPQSWSVLSGAGDPIRSRTAMLAVERRLVDAGPGLVRLFDPPFDGRTTDPGYIKEYPAGVRENGGQYTHAAIWAAMAFARMGEGERAWALFSMLNPIRHGGTADLIETYKVEPYVVAADVYSSAQHVGRGGWTWYTGSAGWMYRLLIESLLGLELEGEHLRLKPCLPDSWPHCTLHYRYRSTNYHIRILRQRLGSENGTLLLLDGRSLAGDSIPLQDDHRVHDVELRLRAQAGTGLVPADMPVIKQGT